VTAVADYLFTDVRRFAVPPGRAYGSERFERRPPRAMIGSLVRRWLGRRGDAWPAHVDGAFELPAYLSGPPQRPRRGA
jgi:hypothetical protein